MNDYTEKFRNIITALDKQGIEYAEAKSLSWYLQEMRKVILADQIKVSTGNSMSEKENNARASEAYKLHLEGTKEAILNELKAKAKYEKIYASYEALRSLSSQYTASMKMEMS